MIDQSIISQLKQNNVSKDSEKTKARILELWKASDSKQKKRIIELGNTNASSIYRVTKLGNVSAKIVIAFSRICNVNPNFLIGASDEPTECTNALINKFLVECGYEDILDKQPKKQQKKHQKMQNINSYSEVDNILNETDAYNDTYNDTFDEEIEQLIEIDAANVEPSQEEPVFLQKIKKDSDDLVTSIVNLFSQKQNEITDAQIHIMQTLSQDDVDNLFKALSIKSKAGGNASIISKIIKLLLIS